MSGSELALQESVTLWAAEQSDCDATNSNASAPRKFARRTPCELRHLIAGTGVLVGKLISFIAVSLMA